LGAPTLRKALEEGTARINVTAGKSTVNYLRNAEKVRIEAGEIEVLGKDEDGALILRHAEGAQRITRPKTVWTSPAHDAGLYGTQLLRSILPGRSFPFPKSLYAVEDALRFVVGQKPKALVIDFFAGSGTTCHAVMRLNKQDGGRRTSISITNNEVSADEQKELIKLGLRPGDPDWEKLGICDYITKPRIKSSILGWTPEGDEISGEYKFGDIYPFKEGFEENAEFFTLTYENSLNVLSGRSLSTISPLLWLRAGAVGPRIAALLDGWAVTENYGILTNMDKAAEFSKSVTESATISTVFIFTDEDRVFESIAQSLPPYVETVRMYDEYIRTCDVDALAVTR
jgi:adenine-specific DNA-methyltransferase